MLMVGMEGSAVLAVRKVVVVAREVEREVAEGAEAGSARVACEDGGSAGCGRAGCDRAGCGRAGCACVLRRPLQPPRLLHRSSAGTLQPPRLLHRQPTSRIRVSFQRCELAVNNLGWKPTRRRSKRADDVSRARARRVVLNSSSMEGLC